MASPPVKPSTGLQESTTAKPSGGLQESTYITRVGLLLMILGTVTFSTVSTSLSTTTLSPSLTPSSAIPQSQHQLQTPISEDNIQDVVRCLEVQIQTLAETVTRLQQQQTSVLSGKGRQSSNEDNALAQCWIVAFLSLVAWIIGLIILSEGLMQVARVRWLRTAQLGLVGANLGVLYAMWIAGSAGWTVMLSGFVGADMGLLVGSLWVGS